MTPRSEGRSGAAGDEDAFEALKVLDESTLCQAGLGAAEFEDGVGMGGGALEGEHAAGAEGFGGLFDEGADEVEPVRAAAEGERGFVVADVAVEGFPLGIRDVGRVGQEEVEPAPFGPGAKGVEQGAVEELDAISDGVGGGVFGGEGEGVGGDVGGEEGSTVAEVVGEDDGDGAGAGADVGEAEGCVVEVAVAGALKYFFDNDFG